MFLNEIMSVMNANFNFLKVVIIHKKRQKIGGAAIYIQDRSENTFNTSGSLHVFLIQTTKNDTFVKHKCHGANKIHR